jgi:hypothetical protein
MNDKSLRVLASIGLGVGGALGMVGTFAPSASLRGLAWGIDGVALVMASPLLTVRFYRMGQDFVAAGFLVFAIGEGIIVSGAAMDLPASVPSFGAGAGLWAVALLLISIPRNFPIMVRLSRPNPKTEEIERHDREDKREQRKHRDTDEIKRIHISTRLWEAIPRA